MILQEDVNKPLMYFNKEDRPRNNQQYKHKKKLMESYTKFPLLNNLYEISICVNECSRT